MKNPIPAIATLLISACNFQPPTYDQATSQTDGIAIGGYDPVAYQVDAEAIPGDPAITAEHEGATWQFASPENRDRFTSDPGKYAPAFGGHCAFAHSLGRVEAGDPTLFDVVDGVTYLNSNPVARMLWSAP